MAFTQEQKMAISKVLLDILSIDELVDSRETMYFETIKEKLQLTAQDHYDVLQQNTLKCLNIIKVMSDEQKIEFVMMMRQMIVADKYIDSTEATSFYNICEYVKINGIGLTL
jgi:uncharacterized tellurite resistance protein B-like protein